MPDAANYQSEERHAIVFVYQRVSTMIVSNRKSHLSGSVADDLAINS